MTSCHCDHTRERLESGWQWPRVQGLQWLHWIPTGKVEEGGTAFQVSAVGCQVLRGAGGMTKRSPEIFLSPGLLHTCSPTCPQGPRSFGMCSFLQPADSEGGRRLAANLGNLADKFLSKGADPSQVG